MAEHVMTIDEHMGSAQLVVRHKRWAGRCTVQICGNADEFWVLTPGGRCQAAFPMANDPVRAAELAERERCKAAVRMVITGSDAMLTRIDAAIDAPAKEPSESGTEWFQRRFEERLVQLKRNYAPDSRAFKIYEEIQVELREFPTEPPR